MWKHIEEHWLKYYLGAGVAFVAYETFTGPPGSFNLTSSLVSVLTWPVQVVAMVETTLVRPTTAAVPSVSISPSGVGVST